MLDLTRRAASPPQPLTAVLRIVGCLCVSAAAFGRPADAAAVPLAAVRAASHCSGAADAVDCLLRAAAAGVNELARSAEPVDLVPGCVSLVKNAPDPAEEAASDVEADAPKAGASAGAAFVDSVTAFAKSRAISVRAPARLLDAIKSTLTEARGKKDKYAGPLLMGAMMVAGTLLPIKLGALALMSGKALMTSMLALMLSAILALKKLASGGGGGGHSGTTYEVINVPTPVGHGPHGRSLQAHDMAYDGQPTAESAAATTGARR